MKEIETELWDYIDGFSSPEERVRVESRLASDAQYRKVYQELLAMDVGLAALELDEPSMGFTRNVMEAIEAEPRPVAVTINKRLIYGIVAFFGLVFVGVLLALLFSVNWSAQGLESFEFDLKMPAVLTRALLNSEYLPIFYMIDVVLALYVLDGFLRKRLLYKKL